MTWSNFCSSISWRTASRTAAGCGSFFEKYSSQTTSGLAPFSILTLDLGRPIVDRGGSVASWPARVGRLAAAWAWRLLRSSLTERL